MDHDWSQCVRKRGRDSVLYIMICDDETAQTALLEALAGEWAGARKLEIRTEVCQNAEQFLFRQEEKQADIALLDIDMPGRNGLSLARRLRERRDGTQIIFITGLADYALEGYEVDALSYLLKPVRKEKLFACLDKAAERCKREEPALLLELPGGTGRVRFREICYLESAAHDTLIRCVDREEAIRCRVGIQELEERIFRESDSFFRIHRSYLIHLAYVSRIGRREVRMDTGETLPVARGRWEALNAAWLKYYRGKV